MKKPTRNALLAVLLALPLLCGALLAVASRAGHLSVNLPLEHKPFFAADTSAYPSRLSAAGATLVDASGRVVVLRGLMPADPAVLAHNGRFNRAFFAEMAGSGANAIRLPVHPER